MNNVAPATTASAVTGTAAALVAATWCGHHHHTLRLPALSGLLLSSDAEVNGEQAQAFRSDDPETQPSIRHTKDARGCDGDLHQQQRAGCGLLRQRRDRGQRLHLQRLCRCAALNDARKFRKCETRLIVPPINRSPSPPSMCPATPDVSRTKAFIGLSGYQADPMYSGSLAEVVRRGRNVS